MRWSSRASATSISTATFRRKGLKLWIDVPDPGWGSPIGNSLDRGGGYLMAQYRNHFDSHCGMEVVLANGEVMRTGMGAMPGAKTWQQYKTGFGPWIDGMFSQSNFGVVTKMGFWLMPEPDAYLSGTVYVPRHDDLIPLVDIMTNLENTRVTNGMPDIGQPPALDSDDLGNRQMECRARDRLRRMRSFRRCWRSPKAAGLRNSSNTR